MEQNQLNQKELEREHELQRFCFQLGRNVKESQDFLDGLEFGQGSLSDN